MTNNIFLSIIIPAYNEENNIERTLKEIAEYLEKKDFSAEVLVIDDDSCDRTVEKARSLSSEFSDLQVIRSSPNRGKGHVIRKGMLNADGKFIMFMDADNATSIIELENFFSYMEEGYDIVIASRRLKDSRIEVAEPLMRVFLGNIYIWLSNIFISWKIHDFNCGFKVFTHEAARNIFSVHTANGWTIDAELIFIAKKRNMRIKEVPVKWIHHNSTTKVKLFRAGIQSFLGLIGIHINNIKGAYRPLDSR